MNRNPAYTINTIPNNNLLVYSISNGIDFQTINITPKHKYRKKKKSPKTNRNRCKGDFCLNLSYKFITELEL